MQTMAFSGWSVGCAYAENFPALIAGLESGRCVDGKQWFADEVEQQDVRLAVNPCYVPYKTANGDVQERLLHAAAEALSMAGLTTEALQGPRVRTCLVGNGLRADLRDFVGYMDRNDPEDLLFTPSIKRLHADSFAQDRLAAALTRHWRLSWPPVSMYSTSNSSLAALHLAYAAIASGEVDVVLLVGWVEMTLQDVLFLGGQNMFSAKPSQPFSHGNNSVMMADGAMAMVLESSEHLRRRGKTPAVTLRSTVSYQSSGTRGGSSFSADFRSIIQTLEQAMAAAQVTPEQVACVMPHGNGMQAGDKAEMMALFRIWGEKGVPVVSYKGQFGYFSTCSSLVDLMIACDALQQRRLLAFTTRSPLDDAQLHFHADSAPLPLEKNFLVKSGLGLDGSVIATVLEGHTEVVNA